MQNKFLYQILCASFIALMSFSAVAQEVDTEPKEKPAKAEAQAKKDSSKRPSTPAPAKQSEATPDLTGKQAVDFPGLTS